MSAPRIFISVAEESADVHAASLVRAAKTILPQASFYGLTGPHLRALGVETVADQTKHAAMLGGVFGVLRKALRTVRTVEESWRRERPDLVVLLDSPELHLGPAELRIDGLAPRAKRLGIPVLYYIAPQTWASRPGRNKLIAKCVDRLACILPFEEQYFRERGIQAEFVGHPLFEALQREVIDQSRVTAARSNGETVIALLPGSRRGVIDAMLPRQLEVIRQSRESGERVHAIISCVAEPRLEQIQRIVQTAGVEAEIWLADNATLLTAVDLVLVASGTAALHVAAYRKPMVVMYDAGPVLGPLHGRFGHLLLRTPHLCLVNILAGSRIVPEFMPYLPDVAMVTSVARQLLRDAVWRRLIVDQLDALVRPLESSQASRRVCEIMQEMLAGRPAPNVPAMAGK